MNFICRTCRVAKQIQYHKRDTMERRKRLSGNLLAMVKSAINCTMRTVVYLMRGFPFDIFSVKVLRKGFAVYHCRGGFMVQFLTVGMNHFRIYGRSFNFSPIANEHNTQTSKSTSKVRLANAIRALTIRWVSNKSFDMWCWSAHQKREDVFYFRKHRIKNK